MTRLRMRLAGAMAVTVMAISALAQEKTSPLSTATPAVPSQLAAVEREIDDPNSGMRWLMVEDPAHPGGPGRLVLSGEGKGEASWRTVATRIARASAVIHTGDAVQLEEHSPVVDASLQAVALCSAVAGSMLRVRLRIGGRMLKARALGPGRAVLEQTGEAP